MKQNVVDCMFPKMTPHYFYSTCSQHLPWPREDMESHFPPLDFRREVTQHDLWHWLVTGGAAFTLFTGIDHSWNLFLPCEQTDCPERPFCEEVQSSPCGETTRRDLEMRERERETPGRAAPVLVCQLQPLLGPSTTLPRTSWIPDTQKLKEIIKWWLLFWATEF